MTVSENISGYVPGELFLAAERDNNKKRRNLLVNLRQAKHFPAVPSEALGLFDKLGRRMGEALPGGATLIIAFAETATALGARAAAFLSQLYPEKDLFFIHTTRENISREFIIADFSEEHSHASSQLLFCRDKDVFRNADNIVFIDDELTTGKTIINCMNELLPLTGNCRFFAASLINGMNRDNLARFHDNNITPLWLMKTEGCSDIMERDMGISPERDSIPEPADIDIIRENFPYEPRLGCSSADYAKGCEELAENIFRDISPALPRDKSSYIALIGTEECMLPSVILGQLLENKGYNVRCRSTTRSPIIPCCREGYPLFSRCLLDSVYEKGRSVYLYNSVPCALAVIVTDGTDTEALKLTAGAAMADRSVGIMLQKAGEVA